MKTAIIVYGACRQTLVASTTWNLLPIEADWYLNTWDYTQQTYSVDMVPSKYEIAKIKHFFKEILISSYEDYWTNVINKGEINPMFRTFKLLDSIRNKILTGGYERVIILRSDLYLHLHEPINESDFDISNNTVCILGRHEPKDFYEFDKHRSDEVFFVMPIDVFEKYATLEYMLEFNKKINNHADIHRLVFYFFKELGCNIKILDKMRSVIVRQKAEDYYIQNGTISFKTLEDIFAEEYVKRDYIGKFWYRFEKIDELLPDMDKINYSRANGGILKIRQR